MAMVPSTQYEQLMGDFTTINLQLNDTRNKLYDVERQNKALQSTLTTTNKEFTKASTKLKKLERTISKSKDKTALSRTLEENGQLQDQLAALKRVLQTMQEEKMHAQEEAEEERRARLNSLGVDSPKPPLPPRKQSGLFVDDGEDPFADDVDDIEHTTAAATAVTVGDDGAGNGSGNDSGNGNGNGNGKKDNNVGGTAADKVSGNTSGMDKATTGTAAGGGVAPKTNADGSAHSAGGTASVSMKISRRPSAVMEAMAKAQQDELMKLRANLQKETKRADEQNESFQGDLQRVLTRVATKESELQAVKKESTNIIAAHDETKELLQTALNKVDELQSLVEDSSTKNVQHEKMVAELRAFKQKVETLAAINTTLKKDKDNSDEALAGFSNAHQDALAKAEKEKEQQLSEMSTDLKIEIQMLKDSLKKKTEEKKNVEEKMNTIQNDHDELSKVTKEKEETLEMMEKQQLELENELEVLQSKFSAVESEKHVHSQNFISLQEQHNDLTSQHEEITAMYERTQKEHEAAKEQIHTHDAEILKVKKKMDDKTVEHKISSRRQKDLIKDLKRSLIKETKKKDDIMTEIDSLKERVEQNEVLEQRINELESEVNESRRSSSNGGGGGGGGGSNSSSPKLPPRSKGKGNNSAGSGAPNKNNDDGVTAALAGRLEQLLTENVYVKEKIGMLESIVQDLTNDLAEKKMTIKNMEKVKKKSHVGNSSSSSSVPSPPNFNLGTVAFSSPETRNRGSTIADAVDEI